MQTVINTTAANTPKLLSIVVPTYKEQESLPILFGQINDATHALRALNVEYEIIIVDDNSPDGTQDVVRQHAATDARIRMVIKKKMSKNRTKGKEFSMLLGFECAKGDMVTVLDADGQDPIEAMVEMVRLHLKTGRDIRGQRAKRDEGKFRVLLTNGFYAFAGKMLDVALPRNTGDFGIFTRESVELMLQYRKESFLFMKGVIADVCGDAEFFQYNRPARSAGESTWGGGFAQVKKLAIYALRGMLAWTDKPMYAPIVMAAMFAIVMLVAMLTGFGLSLLMPLGVMLVLASLGVMSITQAKTYATLRGRPQVSGREIALERASAEVLELGRNLRTAGVELAECEVAA
jgi:glycosyltransferase involved in cell wall biosynthesis